MSNDTFEEIIRDVILEAAEIGFRYRPRNDSVQAMRKMNRMLNEVEESARRRYHYMTKPSPGA